MVVSSEPQHCLSMQSRGGAWLRPAAAARDSADIVASFLNESPPRSPRLLQHIAPSSHKSHICFDPCGTDCHCSAATVHIHHKSAYFQIPSEPPHKGMAIAHSGTEQAWRKEEEKAHSILPWCNSASMTIAAVCSSGMIDKDHVLQRGAGFVSLLQTS